MKIIKSLLLPLFIAILTSSLAAQRPERCKKLPRAAYSKLERVPISDPWFEVYKIRPGIFAIYEPHQLEEVISYLILDDEKAGDEKAGGDKALLFDTGMGIGNIQAVVTGLTKLPVSIVNSHTHNDHVGDNWRFSEVYGMDTDFTRTNARGSAADAQAELASDELCGALPAGFDAKSLIKKVNREDLWRQAAKELGVAAADIPASTSRGKETFFDGKVFDPDKPDAYLKSLSIKRVEV